MHCNIKLPLPPLQIYLLHSRLQQHRILLRQLPQDLPGLLHPADVILVLRPLHPDHGLPGAVRGGGTGVHVPHRGPTAQLLVAHHDLGHLGIAPDCGVLGVAAAVATARGELDSLPSQYCGGTVTTGAVCGIGSDTEMTTLVGAALTPEETITGFWMASEGGWGWVGSCGRGGRERCGLPGCETMGL